MRYDKILFVCILACILILSGCKSRQEITRSVTDQTRIERRETAVDTSRTIVSDKDVVNRETEESEDIYTRTQHYDTLGNLRTIQETWRSIGRFELALRERSASYISINGMGAITSEFDSSAVVTTEQVKNSSDSRPVQGIEWMWVIAGVGLLIYILIMYLINR